MTQQMHDAFGGEAPRQHDLLSAESASVQREESAGGEHIDTPTQSETDATSLASENKTEQRPRRKSSRPRKASPARSAKSGPAEQTGDAVQALEAQGFTEVEARRLIYISDHLAQSAEAREAEAALRRLHFTRWLIEHGMLDEWSA